MGDLNVFTMCCPASSFFCETDKKQFKQRLTIYGSYSYIYKQETYPSMVTVTELQTELFSKDIPSFEITKGYLTLVNSSERNRAAFCQKARENSSNPLVAGVAFWLCGQLKQAEELLVKAKDCAQKFMTLGCVYRKQGYFAKALEQFELAGKQRVESLVLAMEKVETLRQAGQYEQAQRELKACSNFQNVSAEYHYQLARIQEILGAYTEAANQYQTAINLDPHHAKALFHMAYLHDLRGDESLAIDYYRQSTAIYPAYTAALLNLAVLYEERGDYSKSTARFSRAAV
jgi:tetratricopeptide (TPR) repeat protein